MLLYCGSSSRTWCSISHKLCKFPAATSHVRMHSYYIVSLPVHGVVDLVASCCFGLFPLPDVVVVSASYVRLVPAFNKIIVMLLAKDWVVIFLLTLYDSG